LSGLRTFFAAREGNRGQSLVEFAVLVPLILLIVTGVFDLARAVWQENTLAYAAREGTRYAIVHGSNSPSPVGPTNPSDPAIAAVRGSAVGVRNITVTTRGPTTPAARPATTGAARSSWTRPRRLCRCLRSICWETLSRSSSTADRSW